MKRTTNRVYNKQYSGVIVAGMVNDVLSGDGITANYAIREDNTQAEFAQGTLSGTVATNNLGGDLELALAGNAITILENKTSNFSAGTLTNMTAANNAVGPSATNAIRIRGTQSTSNTQKSYFYMKIYVGVSFSVISSRYLQYDIWIDPSSPSGQIGVDIVFTDGTSLRDAAQSYLFYDAQNFPPHPNNDLTGFATGVWYHRKFLMDNFVGKSIAYMTVACEGDKLGTYTGWIKNISGQIISNSTVNTFFGGTLNVNPPQLLQNGGYSNISCTVVPTYDCSVSNRVSPAYNIDPVKIVKDSFISFETSLPPNYDFNLSYSIDGGNSYIDCVNNTALPDLPAGFLFQGRLSSFSRVLLKMLEPLQNNSLLLIFWAIRNHNSHY